MQGFVTPGMLWPSDVIPPAGEYIKAEAGRQAAGAQHQPAFDGQSPLHLRQGFRQKCSDIGEQIGRSRTRCRASQHSPLCAFSHAAWAEKKSLTMADAAHQLHQAELTAEELQHDIDQLQQELVRQAGNAAERLAQNEVVASSLDVPDSLAECQEQVHVIGAAEKYIYRLQVGR